MTEETLEVIPHRTNLSVERSPEKKDSGAGFEVEYWIEDSNTHEWIASVTVNTVISREDVHLSITEIQDELLRRAHYLLSLTATRIGDSRS